MAEQKNLLAVRLTDTANREQKQKIYDGLNNTKFALRSQRIDMKSYGSYTTTDILNVRPKSHNQVMEITMGRRRGSEFRSHPQSVKQRDSAKRSQSTQETLKNRQRPQKRSSDRLAPCCFCPQSQILHRCTTNATQTRRAICERDNDV